MSITFLILTQGLPKYSMLIWVYDFILKNFPGLHHFIGVAKYRRCKTWV